MKKKLRNTRRVSWEIPVSSGSIKPRDRRLVFCPQCYRSKLQFKTRQEADKHLAWNSSKILEENGKAPIRSYWCSACCCYHITSKPNATWEQDPIRSEILSLLGQSLISENLRDSKDKITCAYIILLDHQNKPWAQEVANKILVCLNEVNKREEQ